MQMEVLTVKAANRSEFVLFVGAEPPEIEIMQGYHLIDNPGEEIIRKTFRLDEEGVRSIIEGAQWMVSAAGEFRLTPARAALLQQPVRSITGKARINEKTIAFQASSDSPGLSPGIYLDGSIHFLDGDDARLDAIYANAAVFPPYVARITQRLRRQPAAAWSIALDETGADLQTPTTIDAPLSPAEAEEGILPSAIFQIMLQGETEAGSFGPFPGRLLLLSSHLDAERRYAITLVTEGPLANGWVYWDGHTEIPERDLQINDDQITIEHTGGNAPHPRTWWTLPKESEMAIPVHIEKAALTISVRDDQVVGELTGTGIYQWNEQSGLPSSLHARFTGEREGGEALRHVNAVITNASRIDGVWNASDPLLGRVELGEEEEAIRGSFAGDDQGKLSGLLSGSRIDFQWESRQEGTGWGFLRMVSEGRLMAGLWGREDSPAAARSLLLVRETELDFAGREITLADAREVRAFAGDLILRKEYDRAAAILEKVLALYAVEFEAAAASDFRSDDLLLNQASALSWLALCYFNLGRYDRLLDRLEAVIEVQRGLSPDESLKRLSQQRLADLSRAARSAQGLVEAFPSLLSEVSAEAQAMAGDKALHHEHLRWSALAETADSFARMLDAIQSRLKSFEAAAPEQGEAKTLLSAISTQATTIRDELQSAIREILSLRSRLFSGEEELLQAANRLAAQFGADASFDPRSLNLNDAVTLEEEIVQRLKESLRLSRVEKQFFRLSMQLIGVLQSISFEFDHQRRFIEQMGIGTFHENRRRQAEEWAAGLADYLECWRERLLTDADKIAARAV